MMPSRRTLLLVCVVCAVPALATELETGLFCRLSVEPNPAFTESLEAMQKRFLSVARERSGYQVLLRQEVEDAIAAAKVTDYASSDASLAKIAVRAKVKNAGFVSLKLTDRNELLLEGRVVRDDGKLLKSSVLAQPRGTGPILDVLTTAAERFFDQLNGLTPVAVVTPVTTTSTGSGGAGKVVAPLAVIEPTTPSNPGTALRVLGAVLGGAGVATTVVGVVIFANAGSVTRDASGNIAAADAPRVPAIRSQQGAALGLVTAGAALGITGVVMALLAPSAPVTAALAPRSDGAVLVVEGSF
jgi:hypothetical protein